MKPQFVERKKKVGICFRFGAECHISTDCKQAGRLKYVNEIKDLDMTINKTNFIYLDKFRISPIIGTGADENYITKTLVN